MTNGFNNRQILPTYETTDERIGFVMKHKKWGRYEYFAVFNGTNSVRIPKANFDQFVKAGFEVKELQPLP